METWRVLAGVLLLSHLNFLLKRGCRISGIAAFLKQLLMEEVAMGEAGTEGFH